MNTEVTCIIVDDEIENQVILSRMFDQYCPTVRVLGKAENVEEAVELIHSKKPDVVFLDIEMPGGDGFTLFDKIKNPSFCTIFTTSHAEYAIKAIKFAAFDYLLKPVNLTEVKTCIERIAEKLRSGYNKEDGKKMVDVLQANRSNQKNNFTKIALPTSEGIEFYKISDIVRCEADRAYCIFHMTGKRRIVVSKSLSEYEDILSEANFFRVHKSNLVNAEHIVKYIRGSGGFLKLSDDSMVAVAIRKKESLLNWLRKKNPAFDIQEVA